MSLKNTLNSTISSILDIREAIQERGVSTKGIKLKGYGDLIRRISIKEIEVIESSQLFIKKIIWVKTFAKSFINKTTNEFCIVDIDKVLIPFDNLFILSNDILPFGSDTIKIINKTTNEFCIVDIDMHSVELLEMS